MGKLSDVFSKEIVFDENFRKRNEIIIFKTPAKHYEKELILISSYKVLKCEER